jgi:D-alanyl-lipoteichoic acid acyltransferase DltB (MBOAT superfamily)
VAFFPQLVAGPIERAPHLIPQLAQKQPCGASDWLAGTSRILWGLMKKLVFADWISLYVAQVYGQPAGRSHLELWLATWGFACQIYLDFSAYSDIAIGSARLMGVDLMENFRWPYLARNLSEFWSRWHISLSTWLRDYLYIPLGGSRRGPARTLCNVLLVMLLGGLWHGAELTFAVWGLWIGLGLALFHAAARWRPAWREPAVSARWHEVPGILLTFHWMLVSWVFFRADSLGAALGILRDMALLAPGRGLVDDPVVAGRTAALIGLVLLAHVLRGLQPKLRWERIRSPVALGTLWGGLIILMAVAHAPAQEPFIYFQF